MAVNTELATRAAQWLRDNPGNYNPYSAYDYTPGPGLTDTLAPGDPVRSDMRLSAASVICHLSGYTLSHSNGPCAHKDGILQDQAIAEIAVGLIGLDYRFDHSIFLCPGPYSSALSLLNSLAATRTADRPPVVPVDAPPQVVAQAVLDYLHDNPEVHDQANWMNAGIDRYQLLPGDSAPACGTTMCIAGTVCWITGHTLRRIGSTRYLANWSQFVRGDIVAYRQDDGPDGSVYRVATRAAQLLGLERRQAHSLFFEEDSAAAIDRLRAIAQGTSEDQD
jgi:hypothetical protein